MLQAGRGGDSCSNSQIMPCAQSQAEGYCWESRLLFVVPPFLSREMPEKPENTTGLIREEGSAGARGSEARSAPDPGCARCPSAVPAPRDRSGARSHLRALKGLLSPPQERGDHGKLQLQRASALPFPSHLGRSPGAGQADFSRSGFLCLGISGGT